MQDLREVYFNIQAKKKEKKELVKMFQDELAHNGDYQKILEDMKVLKERKKSIETQAKAQALSDAQQLEDLSEDIKSGQEMLSDIALSKIMAREPVEIVDEAADTRLVPIFSVKFKKEEGESYQEQADAKRAESHADRLFAPLKIAKGAMSKEDRDELEEQGITVRSVEEVEEEEKETAKAE